MKTFTAVSAVFLTLFALAAPAAAKHKQWNDGWQDDWRPCQGWDCDRPGWQQDWQPGWQQDWGQGRSEWRPGWQPGWQPGWIQRDRNNPGLSGVRPVPREFIVRQLHQHGFESIREVRLDDDRLAYKASARNRWGQTAKLVFHAKTGELIYLQYVD